jgi:hypothetical protein
METIVKLLDFTKMKSAVAKQFELMSKHELFRVNLDGDGMWNTYLESFPVGTDPILRVRTEHNCSCCRQFIRSIGNAVAVIDGKIVSVWDIKVPGEPAYQVVADAMSRLVKSHAIDNIFLTTERTAGTDRSFESMVDLSRLGATTSLMFRAISSARAWKLVLSNPKLAQALMFSSVP